MLTWVIYLGDRINKGLEMGEEEKENKKKIGEGKSK